MRGRCQLDRNGGPERAVSARPEREAEPVCQTGTGERTSQTGTGVLNGPLICAGSADAKNLPVPCFCQGCAAVWPLTAQAQTQHDTTRPPLAYQTLFGASTVTYTWEDPDRGTFRRSAQAEMSVDAPSPNAIAGTAVMKDPDRGTFGGSRPTDISAVRARGSRPRDIWAGLRNAQIRWGRPVKCCASIAVTRMPKTRRGRSRPGVHSMFGELGRGMQSGCVARATGASRRRGRRPCRVG